MPINSQLKPYQINDYKQWISLPPKIQIPYNQTNLFIFELKFQKLTFLNGNFKYSYIKKDTLKNSKNNKQNNQFSINTYWWGQDNPYKFQLINQVKISVNKQKKQKQQQNNIQSSEKTQDQHQKHKNGPQYFKPIRFLICCPLDNFLRYCKDMKVLKIQLLSSQLGVILAKTFINFLSLNNFWCGQPVQIILPLFSSNISLNAANIAQNTSVKNQKIIGQIKVFFKIEKIINPYKMIPVKQSNNIIDRKQINNEIRQSFLNFEDNNNNRDNFMMSNRSKSSNQKLCLYQKKQQKIKHYIQKNKQIQNENLYINEHQIIYKRKDNQNQQMNIINMVNYPQNKFKQKHNDSNIFAPYNQRKVKQEQYPYNFQRQNSQKNKIKFNYEKELIHLQQDFNQIISVQNPLYNSIFRKKNQNQQTNQQFIQFKVKLLMPKLLSQQFSMLKIKLPILSQGFNTPNSKMNEYFIYQTKSIIKLQLNTQNFTTKQIQQYLKFSQLQIQVFFNSIEQDNQKKKQLKKIKSNSIKNQTLLKGKIGIINLIANCQTQYKVQLIPVNKQKKKQNFKEIICLITAISPEKQTKNQRKVSKSKEKSIQKIDKKIEQKKQMKILQNQICWLKLDKFIPLNSHHFKQSNIFLKINSIKTQNAIQIQKNYYKNQQIQSNNKKLSNIEIKNIIETKTNWKSFAGQNSLFLKFQNQIITFPILNSQNIESQLFLKIQLWNRQKTNYIIGSSLLKINNEIKIDVSVKNQNKGRRQLQVKDYKQQTIGFIQIWLQIGDINYINNLIAAHSYSNINQDKKSQMQQNKFRQQQQIKQIQNELSQKKKIQQEMINSSSNPQYDLIQSHAITQNNYSISQSNSTQKLNENKKFNQMQKDNIQIKKLNGLTLLQIHNQIFLQIIRVQRINQINHHFKQINSQKYNIKQGKCIITKIQFTKFLLQILIQNKNNFIKLFSNKMYIIKFIQQNQWIQLLLNFYQQFSNKQINFTQFQQSFRSFQTYYGQIIDQKNHVFERFKQILNQTSLQINDFQQLFQKCLLKTNYKNIKSSRKIIGLLKSVIIEKVMKSSRINQRKNVQLQTVIQNFFSFYVDQLGQFLKCQNQKKYIHYYTSTVKRICDQLRKFQVYQTTTGSSISTQFFKSFISQSVRQILGIDYYVSAKQLMKMINTQQIELSKWEILNLKCQQMQPQIIENKMKQKHSNEKIIVKSPTFGVLQLYNNDIGSQRQKQKLFSTSPLQYNPSLLKNMIQKPKNNINLLDISQNQKKNSNESQILKKRIQMISPINANEVNINKQLAKIVEPFSNLFSSNYNSNLLFKNNSIQGALNINSENQNTKMDFMKKYQSNLSASEQAINISDSLIAIFSNLCGLIKSIQINNNTFYCEIEQYNYSMSVVEQKSKYQKSMNDLSIPNNSKSNISNNNTKINQGNAQIRLFGIKRAPEYLIKLNYLCQKQKQKIEQIDQIQLVLNQIQILVSCYHGQWQNMIDYKGNQVGIIKICSQSEIQNQNSQISQNK